MARAAARLYAIMLAACLALPGGQSGGAAGEAPFRSTGWFRFDRAQGRDLLVTPDGGGFVALGVNHLGALGRGKPLAGAQLEALVARLREWNMNNLGYGAAREMEDAMPYFAAITVAPIEKHRSHPAPGHPDSYSFPDPFDPSWEEKTERLIAEACARHRDKRNLIGYFWTDTPTWDLVKTRALRGTEWVSEIRRLAPGVPGRRRYGEFLAAKYAGRLDELNAIYGLSLGRLEEALSADLSRIAIGRHVVASDDEEFLGIVARRFYEVVGGAQRKHDPHHLVFGDRYLAGDAPDRVLLAAAPYIDAVAVQPGDRYTVLYPPSTVFPEEELDRMHRLTGKPVLICDHAISFPTAEHPMTIFEQAPSEEEAARGAGDFVRKAMAKPYITGYLRCQYIDRPAAYGRGLRQGLVDARGQPRPLLVGAYKRAFGEWLRSVSALLP